MKKKKRKLTLKQRKLLKELPDSTSFSDAARKAGYAENTVRQAPHRFIAEHSTKLTEALEKHGLTEDKIAQTIAEGLEASTIFFFNDKIIGRLNQRTIETLAKKGVEIGADDFVQLPDHYARHKYLDTLTKISGYAKGDDDKPSSGQGITNILITNLSEKQTDELVKYVQGKIRATD